MAAATGRARQGAARATSDIADRGQHSADELGAGAGELEPLRWQVMETGEQGRLWTELIERHHYLGTACPWARIYAI